MTLKPVQQANGKRSFKFTKASQAQPSTAKHSQHKAKHSQHSPAQPCATLHGTRYLFALFSAACCTCTALVIFSLSFRPLTSLARPWLSFRSLFGRLLRSERPSSSFRSLFVRLFRLHGPRYLFVIFSFSFRTSWALLGSVFASLGPSWLLLGPCWRQEAFKNEKGPKNRSSDPPSSAMLALCWARLLSKSHGNHIL